MAYRRKKYLSLLPPYGEIDWGDTLNNQLVGWYPLTEDGGGKATDLVTRISGTRSVAPPSVGHHGKAPQFSGTGYIRFVNNALVPGNTNGFTVSVWAKPPTAASEKIIFAQNTGDNTEWSILVTDDGTSKWRFGVLLTGGNSRLIYSATAAYRVGKWHHLVGTYNRAGLSAFYVDGVLQGTDSTTPSAFMRTPPTDKFFGAFNSSLLNAFSGAVSDARLWSRAISAAEVRELYTNPTRGIVGPKRRVASGIAAQAYTINAESGSYTLTGALAALLYSRKLAADPGSYSLTGVSTSLIAARKLIASPGSYAISGASAGLIAARRLSAAPGSYTITGMDSSLRAQRIMNAEAGSYAINGFAATLNYSGVTVSTFSYAELEAALSSLLVSGSTGATHIFVEGMEREVLNLSHMPLINIRVVESTPEIVSLPNKYYERVQLAIDIVAFDFTSYSAASRIRSALVRSVRDLIVSNRQFYSLLDATSIGPNVSFGASGTRENNGHIAMATMTVLCEAYVN